MYTITLLNDFELFLDTPPVSLYTDTKVEEFDGRVPPMLCR